MDFYFFAGLGWTSAYAIHLGTSHPGPPACLIIPESLLKLVWFCGQPGSQSGFDRYSFADLRGFIEILEPKNEFFLSFTRLSGRTRHAGGPGRLVPRLPYPDDL
jgi:hypothetical protein